MAFQARLREMKKAGWYSKEPTGLSVDFGYLKPGRTKKDLRGEEELMKYLDKLDIGEEESEERGICKCCKTAKRKATGRKW
ncbi:Hypothetical protein PHPALM_9010 [Phytophthora palmivora]|uniref:Uncharacterized protein n=1 Tax=Phytophthora palmivora TaxID=4796 RepID=A0A2P4Y8D8_9STRA|nr:Hypothetical protein PHPALM_9010 [Phytophthora palmivora]